MVVTFFHSEVQLLLFCCCCDYIVIVVVVHHICSCTHLLFVVVHICCCCYTFVVVLVVASVLGVHCEGPFINLEKKGAHEESFIQNTLSPALIKESYGSCLDNIRIVTLAPELNGSSETIRWLSSELGMVVSLGHSMSSLKTAEKAVGCGASLITHLFNAMLPVCCNVVDIHHF